MAVQKCFVQCARQKGAHGESATSPPKKIRTELMSKAANVSKKKRGEPVSAESKRPIHGVIKRREQNSKDEQSLQIKEITEAEDCAAQKGEDK